MRADDTRRILVEAGAERPAGASRTLETTLNARKPMIWIAALICLALLTGAGAEQWTLWREQQAVEQARMENMRMQLDIDETRQALAQAQTPAAIERSARRLGYIYPGDTPIIIAQPHP